MKYVDIVKNLKKEKEGYVVLIKSGIFFISIGEDAVFLNEKLGLKLTCMNKGLCKVGFQVKSLEKYIHRLQDENIAFAIYNYEKVIKPKPELIYINNGAIKNNNEQYIFNCENCDNKQDTENDIIERVKKLGKIG